MEVEYDAKPVLVKMKCDKCKEGFMIGDRCYVQIRVSNKELDLMV